MGYLLYGSYYGMESDIWDQIEEGYIEAQAERELQDLEEAACLYNMNYESFLYV